MKTLIALFMLMFSAYSMACSCSDYPMSPRPAMKEYLSNHYGIEMEFNKETLRWVAYYPALDEKLFWNSVRGTSCEGSGPNGEIMAHCARSRKSDYLVVVPERNCQLVLRVKTTYKSVKVREISSTCH